MSNRRTTAKPATVPAAPPKPFGPGYARGQQAAQQFLEQIPWDEYTDAIKGLRDTLRTELNSRLEKLNVETQRIQNAINAAEE